MKATLMWGTVLMFVMTATAGPVFAQDAFHMAYRQENVVVEGNAVTGNLLVSVYNVSGAEARDVVVSVPGPNNVTYDNRTIFIGTLADGQRVEALDVFRVPAEMRTTESVEEQVAWDVEYTTASGERKKTQVTGRNVQIHN